MFLFFVCSTFVIAAVSVVFPWSMCPIVPMFTCGFVRSYFALAMAAPPTPCLTSASARHRPAGRLRRDLLGDGGRHFLVARELHGVRGSALCHRPQIGGIAEH